MFEIKPFQANFIQYIIARILLHVKFVNILKYSNKEAVLHLKNINLPWK